MASAELRVLYLAPRGRSPEQLSRYSFLDEEIRALALAGVHAYVLCDDRFPSFDDGRLHVRALPRDRVETRLKVAAFVARNRRAVPGRNLAHVRECYQAMRVEQYAADVIRAEKIDLVHSYFGWPRGYGGLLASGDADVPLVAGLRGADVNVLPAYSYGARRRRSFDRALRRLLARADRTVYVSEFLKRVGLELGARPESAQVILKGVRLDLFKDSTPVDRARHAIGADARPLLLSVAGLVPIKGVDDILEALKLLRDRGVDFQYVVCGDGPERAALTAQIERLGLATCVRLAGRVSRADIQDYFRAADVFVHAAKIEASGNVLLEALSSGVPVVCTDAGGPAEYVANGETGFVVPVGDVHALAARIERLLADVPLRESMGRTSRRRAEDLFGYDAMIGQTVEVYRSVLDARRQSLRP